MRTRDREIPTDCDHVSVTYDETPPRCARVDCEITWPHLHPNAPPTTAERIDSVIAALQKAKEAHAKVEMFTAEGSSGTVALRRATEAYRASLSDAVTGARKWWKDHAPGPFFLTDGSYHQQRAAKRNRILAEGQGDQTAIATLAAAQRIQVDQQTQRIVAEIGRKGHALFQDENGTTGGWNDYYATAAIPKTALDAAKTSDGAFEMALMAEAQREGRDLANTFIVNHARQTKMEAMRQLAADFAKATGSSITEVKHDTGGLRANDMGKFQWKTRVNPSTGRTEMLLTENGQSPTWVEAPISSLPTNPADRERMIEEWKQLGWIDK